MDEVTGLQICEMHSYITYHLTGLMRDMDDYVKLNSHANEIRKAAKRLAHLTEISDD